MSEIEKMFENAGIRYINLNTCKIDETGKNGKCETIFYPEFTAEKQLELILWLANNKDIEISKHFIDLKNNRVHCVSRQELQFEESLAKLINLIWQSLSDTEKAEIKRILE